MSTLTVSVASPDKRSVCKITVAASITVKQLVKEACFRLKLTSLLDSPESLDYSLQHGRALLDDSTLLRLAGLAQGAKLDLVKRKPTRMTDEKVQVVLQVPIGTRIMVQCSCQSVLLAVLLKAASAPTTSPLDIYKVNPDSTLMEPHLLINGQEFFGLSKLVETRLLDIGITRGNCLVRMSLKRGSCNLQRAHEIIESVALETGSGQSDLSPSETSSPSHTSMSVETDSRPVQETIFTNPSGSVPSSTRRSIALYKPPQTTANLPAAPDLPDSSYELGESELRLQWTSSQAKTHALLNAPLVSRRKLDEKWEAEFLAKHPEARIRFRFPDQYLLETTFKSTDTPSQLYTFIAEMIGRPSEKIVLTTGPPPRFIKNDSTALWKLDLVPAAIINVSVEDERIGAADLVDENLLSSARSLPVSPALVSAESRPTPQQQPMPATSTSAGGSAPAKKPAWLRLGH